MSLNPYINLTQTISEFQKRGFHRTFHFENNQLQCYQNGKKFGAEEVEIVEYHRFGGDDTHPQESIIFAIECNDGEKGYIVSNDNNLSSIRLRQFMDKAKIKLRKSITLSRKQRAS